LLYVEAKGAKVPAIGFGTYHSDGEALVRLLRYALEIGYRHIDSAASYRNEAEVGRAVRQSGVGREELFLATKVPQQDLGREAVRRSLEASLRHLGTDYVDLLLIHWPSKVVPLGETLDVLAELRAAGKMRHLGVCNFSVPLLVQAVEDCGADLLTNQVEYHVLLAQDPVLSYLRARGMMLTAHSPLAAGVAAMRPDLARAGQMGAGAIRRIGGTYARPLVRMVRNWLRRPRAANPLGQPSIPRHPLLARIGAPYGKSAAQVALRWLVEQEGVVAIPRPGNERECRENLDIFDFALTPEDRRAIAGLAGDYRIVRNPITPAYDPGWRA
jgi:2,5-diketo-D-gluconate reductase B